MLLNGLTRTIEVFSRNPDNVSWMVFYLGKYEVADRRSAASDFRHGLCQPTLAPLSILVGLLSTKSPANAAPEWQARSYYYRRRLDGGLSTPGACSKVSHHHSQRTWISDTPAYLKQPQHQFSGVTAYRKPQREYDLVDVVKSRDTSSKWSFLERALGKSKFCSLSRRTPIFV